MQQKILIALFFLGSAACIQINSEIFIKQIEKSCLIRYENGSVCHGNGYTQQEFPEILKVVTENFYKLGFSRQREVNLKMMEKICCMEESCAKICNKKLVEDPLFKNFPQSVGTINAISDVFTYVNLTNEQMKELENGNMDNIPKEKIALMKRMILENMDDFHAIMAKKDGGEKNPSY